MKNILTKIGIISLIVMAIYSTVSAQESTTLQFMKGMPQSDLQNPALHNDSSSVVIGLPGMSGVYFDFNSGFAVNDLIHKGTGMLADSLVLDIEGFHSSLSTTNSIQQNLSFPLFYLGFRSKKSFFSIGVTEKEVAQFTFDKSLVTFLKDGNAEYMGQNFDLGNLKMNAFDYTEMAFGYSNEVIKNKLTVGVKAKALLGKFALKTERMNMKVETAADGSSLNLSTDIKINMSMPATPEYDQDNNLTGMNTDNLNPKDFVMQTGNMGMAFDLGAVYKLTPKITLSGSIVDLGKVSFKKDLISLNKVSNYNWVGIDFSNSIDSTNANYVDPADLIKNETTKMENAFRPKKSDVGSEVFDVTIPTKIYLGGTYQLNNQFSIGLLDRLYKNGDISTNTVTLSANAMLANFLSLTGSYSMIGKSTNNLGMGLAMRLGLMQMYFVSDNLMALADPAKANYVNVRFGMNLLFGRKHKPVSE
ncbi:MAG: DUF5723 family protein [Bacteroidota bacterium]|nr:DUF5723 family protein [Bacteroidota bacterium]